MRHDGRVPRATNDPDERFSARYAALGAEAAIETERQVLGSDYQANGYTSLEEARQIGEALMLAPDDQLLDLGSGCGFPGLYLATTFGCGVVTVDPVASGATTAAARAGRDGLADRALAVIGTGTALPFADRRFDALVSVDVMC